MIELLSRVWTGTAATVDQLAEQTRGRMLAAEVAETVEKLEQAGYIAGDSETIAITCALGGMSAMRSNARPNRCTSRHGQRSTPSGYTTDSRSSRPSSAGESPVP
jgi:hypothetical protein